MIIGFLFVHRNNSTPHKKRASIYEECGRKALTCAPVFSLFPKYAKISVSDYASLQEQNY